MTDFRLDYMKKTRTRSAGTPLFIGAAIAGLLHAAPSFYWMCGGMWLLDTVGPMAVKLQQEGNVPVRFLLAAAYRPSTTTCARMGSHCFLGWRFSAYRLGRPWDFCGVAACSNWSSFPKQPAHSRAYLPMESPFLGLGAAIVWCIVHLARSPPESAVNRLKATRHMTLRDVEGICHIATTYNVLGRNGGLNSLGRKLLNVSG